MTRKFLYGLLIAMLLVTSLTIACTKTTATSSATPATTAGQTKTSSTAANWWDKFGEPKYGGTITTSSGVGTAIPSAFDPANWMNMNTIHMEILFNIDWTSEDRNPLVGGWLADEAFKNGLVESWEWSDQQTLVLHVRKGVYWQDKSPVNGREFTANDIQYHYDRMLGTGSGFTAPNPMFGNFTASLEKVTATDNYTAVVKFKMPTPPANFWTMLDMNSQFMEAREWVDMGNPENWQNVAGTGPWTISDYVANVSITAVKNPNYWGSDERYPKNRLPYADTLKTVQIMDGSTELAALRSGQIDVAWDVDWKQAQSLKKTNPDLQSAKGISRGDAVFWRNDTKPFTDIRVRKALQMAIDRNAIARDYYGGNADPTPYGLINPDISGYNYVYNEWPQTLKDEYSFNPTKAKELLAEAGYPQGFKTNILTSPAFDNQLLQAIKSYFNDIGVDMEIKIVDPQVFGGMIGEKKDDQMHFWWSIEPPNMVLILFSSKAGDWGRITDTNFDAIVGKFNSATSLTDAKQLAVEADKYAIENHMSMKTPQIYVYQFWHPYIKGGSGEGRLTGAPRQQFLSRIWIDKD